MKLWLIAKSNMKKKKGNVVIILFLVAMATVMFYVGVSVLKNISGVLDASYQKQNGAHVVLVENGADHTQVEQSITSISGYRKMEKEKCLLSAATMDIKKKNSREKADSMSVLFLDMDKERTISDFKIIDKGKKRKENSILVPMYLKVGKGYQTGDTMIMKANDHTYTFEIYGFVEDVMFASPSNVTLYKCYLGNSYLQKLQKDSNVVKEANWYNIMVGHVEQSSEYEDALSKKLFSFGDKVNVFYLVNYTMMRGGTAMFTNIIMAVFTVFSILFIIIAVVVMRFNVVSNMEENITNIGILQAIGYTSRQLANATILEYMIIGVLGIVTGFLVTMPCYQFMAKLISRSMGMDWEPKVDIFVCMLTVIVIIAIMLGVIFMTSRKFKKISTLSALRDGIQTHHFKRNFIPLYKTFLGKNVAIGFKDILHNQKRSLSVMLIVALLSFGSVVMLVIYANFNGDSSFLVNLVGMEKPEITLDLTQSNFDRITSKLQKDKEVSDFMTYGSVSVSIIGNKKEKSVMAEVYSDACKMKLKNLLRGRRPKQENEINITNVLAKQFGVDIGDTIDLKIGKKKQSYLITGIMQQISNMGIRIVMNEQALKRLMPDYHSYYTYVYLKPDVSVKEKVKEWKSVYKEEDVAITNFEEAYNTILGTFTATLASLCVLFSVITVFVVSLVLILLIRMKFIRDRRMMGVYKALGYTSKALAVQTIWSFLPVVMAGALIGAIAAIFGVNPVFALMLSICGIEKCNLSPAIGLVAVAYGVIVMAALLVILCCSLRIRKLEAYTMITE